MIQMKIRERYYVFDRMKLLGKLMLVLFLLLWLSLYMCNHGVEQKNATIEQFLRTALQPVGQTMYIWGGGWDDADSKAGAGSTQIGVSPQWRIFAEEQDESYNFEEHRYERENGLDCSGYVGWVIYNTFETESGQSGYVTFSTEMARNFADRGWGRYIINPKEFLPGDIVSMEGHVWICLGTCEDGSVLLAHSSPPGVSVCGTVLPQKEKKGQEESQAVMLAKEYMTKFHPQWQEKYPNRAVSSIYLEEVNVFRWNEQVMLDANRLQDLSADEIIVYMSPDV